MSALVWGTEWRLVLADRRTLTLSVLGPLVMVTVIATGGLPLSTAPLAYVTLFAGYGLLRSARSIFSDQQSGLTRRIVNGGVSPAGYLIQKAAASAATTLLLLLPALAVVAASARVSAYDAFVVMAALAFGLWVSCGIGVVIGAVSDSVGELLTVSGLTLAALLHLSGVFRSPPPDGVSWFLEGWSPYRALHEALVSVVSEGLVRGQSAAIGWAAAVTLLLGGAAVRLMSRSPTERRGRAHRR